MTSIRLVADDLTGALDAAVQFTARDPDLAVLLDAKTGGAVPASAAISTNARDLDAAAAASRMDGAAAFLAWAELRFLKIDSLLRGHWPEAIAMALQAGPDQLCVFAPAFPAQQRITRDGRQYAPRADGALVRLERSAVHELARVGLRTAQIPAGIAADPGLAAAPGTVLVCDAIEQDDLDRLVAAARRDGPPILWCGSAGLARALAGRAPPLIVPRPGLRLVIIGSNHCVTRGQVAAVPAAAAARIPLGEDAERAALRIAASLEHGNCIVTPGLPDGLAADAAAAAIEARLRATLPRLAKPAEIVVIGGETLNAVCKAVGADALHPGGEIVSGVPVSRMIGGAWDGTTLISRSGAFGGPDFLARLLAADA
ncbi:MAG: hypothetical protein B7Z59_04810 [Acidiphilium sp. 37-67-22]|nr:MAG: hypothetical protein B7X09_01870 [Acidiphilium sp. 21-66-27]OYW11308.1 MAG: hypothetical protein B7Z59_04810 [Acidiphilium sp. 37-67-22]